MTEPTIGFVCAMGISIVFIGLVSIVFIVWIMGLVCRGTKSKDVAAPVVPAVSAEIIENKQEIIAAVSAVIAEELGKDVSAIRVLSFKKM